MALHFSRVGRATAELEIWSASEGGFSFVISNESSSGPGLRGRPGFAASWRPIHINRSGWADHPSRRSPKPRGLVRPCWNIWLDRFSFGAPLRCPVATRRLFRILILKIELFSRSHLRNQPTRLPYTRPQVVIGTMRHILSQDPGERS